MKTRDKYLRETTMKMRDMTETQAELVALQKTVAGMATDAIDAWLYGNEKMAKGIIKTLKRAVSDMEKLMK